MECPKCHFANPEGMSFCGKCGAKIERACPKCSSLNPPDFLFCGKCGTPLEPADAPPPSPPVDYAAPHSYTPKFLRRRS